MIKFPSFALFGLVAAFAGCGGADFEPLDQAGLAAVGDRVDDATYPAAAPTLPAEGGLGCSVAFRDFAGKTAVSGRFKTARVQRWKSIFPQLHRVHDTVIGVDYDGLNVAVSGDAGIVAKLKYNTHFTTLRQAVSGEVAELWVRTCSADAPWERFGSETSDDDGLVRFSIAAGQLAPGDYAVAVRVDGDGSFATGELGVWPRGTEAVVIDVDGTINQSMIQGAKEAVGLRARPIPTAAQLFRMYAEHGYKIVYLSGRAPSMTGSQREFMDFADFPRGISIFSREKFSDLLQDNAPFKQIPGPLVNFSIVNHKRDTMDRLRDSFGIKWSAGYGDMPTDAIAYFLAGVPREQVWLRGKHHEASVPVFDHRPGKSTPDMIDGKPQKWKVQSSGGEELSYANHIDAIRRTLPYVNGFSADHPHQLF